MSSSSMSSAVPENVVVVAVRAEREISKTALAWALTHIVQPGDIVTLLAVLSDHESLGWRQRIFRGFSRLGGAADHSSNGRERGPISASCSQMALQIDGRNEINVRIKVVGAEHRLTSSSSGSASGSVVVAEAKGVEANWVVLDKKLKQAQKQCIEELQCNIAVMNGSSAKILRLNLGGILNKPLPPFSLSSSYSPVYSEKFPDVNSQKPKQRNNSIAEIKQAPEPAETLKIPSGATGRDDSSFFLHGQNPLFDRAFEGQRLKSIEDVDADEEIGPNGNGSRDASPLPFNFGFEASHCVSHRDFAGLHPFSPAKNQVPIAQKGHNRNASITKPPKDTGQTLLEKFASESKYDYSSRDAGFGNKSTVTEDCLSFSSQVREAVSLYGSSPSIPPPLCSLCKHKAPVFGKPPRQFTYNELRVATDGFSDENFVAEGGSGFVYRGVLEDGQIVAVKQLKVGCSSSGIVIEESEFCAEVEILSRAQHRNVVMLVGFCAERQSRILVYEYICNGSMNTHLHGGGKEPLNWDARVKIAVGVARGLRYLHEDCRVGFVVHKDLRPNNILLTHDYDPLVGDFKLTRWQSETSLIVDTNIPEAFGYLAPEYIEYGIVTDKSDVYAYGVLLLELITGRRAMDTSQPKGQQFLVDWARPLLTIAQGNGHTISVDRFLDRRLGQDQTRIFSEELSAMARAAALCLRRDPQSRPGMSKVLRILEGDTIVDPVLDFSPVGSRSGRIVRPVIREDKDTVGSLSCRFPRQNISSANGSNWYINSKKA